MEKIGLVNFYGCSRCARNGEKPRVNRNFFFSVNLNTGVTPFTSFCRVPNCGDFMQSGMYQVRLRVYSELLPRFGVTKCWYRPTAEEFHAIECSATKEHVRGGGLLLGDFGKVDVLKEAIDFTGGKPIAEGGALLLQYLEELYHVPKGS